MARVVAPWTSVKNDTKAFSAWICVLGDTCRSAAKVAEKGADMCGAQGGGIGQSMVTAAALHPLHIGCFGAQAALQRAQAHGEGPQGGVGRQDASSQHGACRFCAGYRFCFCGVMDPTVPGLPVDLIEPWGLYVCPKEPQGGHGLALLPVRSMPCQEVAEVLFQLGRG